MIDPELVTRKMLLITADLRALEPLARHKLEDYVASPTDEVLVERYLERIIGRMAKPRRHQLRRRRDLAVASSAQTFDVLCV